MITNLILLIQRGGGYSDAYINAAENNSFMGTIGSIIVGAIIWWFIIFTSDSSKK